MRYGNASSICILSVGLVWALTGGCGSSNDGSVFGSGTTTGGMSTGTGITGGTGTGIIVTSGSGSGSGSGTGSGSGVGSGGLSPDASCAQQAADSSAIPVDIFIMLDKSGSMSCPASDDMCETPPRNAMHPTRWEAVTTAINGFVSAPGSAGIGVGIGFFALPNLCGVAGYATPSVAIAPLPGSAGAISMAIAANMPSGNTPTVPALQGALEYAKMYAQNTPGRSAAVVFVTDGLPNGCNSTIPAAAMLATTAFGGMPQIKTYVVGLGATQSLDQIALAGSGGATHYFPATGDVAGQLGAALKTISGAITCDYTIPMNGQVDPKNVNVVVTVGGGMQQGLGYVGSADQCASGGWYYDNPATPTKITLCPQTCDPLKATANSKVQVIYGCPTVGPAIH